MPAVRPLPSRPNLEFEHKDAKTFLRRLRAGDLDSLARACAQHPSIDSSAPERIRLADAQLVIAREYGFTSWPRLARYFGDVDRQRHAHPTIQSHTRDFYDAGVCGLLAQHRTQHALAGLALSAYVPRFYGMRVAGVFQSAVTEDEARLAVARRHGFPSWAVLLEETTAMIRPQPAEGEVDPMRYAAKAMESADLDELRRIIEKHPDLLHPSDYEASKGRSLLSIALHHERARSIAAMQPIVEWLATQGLDLQRELNMQLCGHMRITTDKVRWLLDRGADPNWIAPNGIPVLEYALIRYWNGDAVDVLAARATPRKALWIAAGLGDIDAVRRFLDRDGKPTPEARRLHPDFDAVGMGIPWNPDPDDEEILMAAFFIAMLNGRSAVLEYMVSRGFPVNSLVWESPVINIAVGNAMTPMVECLVRCGADLDLRGWHPTQSAREIARARLADMPQNAEVRRIVELCGMDPDAILAEGDKPPG